MINIELLKYTTTYKGGSMKVDFLKNRIIDHNLMNHAYGPIYEPKFKIWIPYEHDFHVFIQF